MGQPNPMRCEKKFGLANLDDTTSACWIKKPVLGYLVLVWQLLLFETIGMNGLCDKLPTTATGILGTSCRTR